MKSVSAFARSDGKRFILFRKKNLRRPRITHTPENPELIIYRIEPSRVRFMREWALEYVEVPPEA